MLRAIPEVDEIRREAAKKSKDTLYFLIENSKRQF